MGRNSWRRVHEACPEIDQPGAVLLLAGVGTVRGQGVDGGGIALGTVPGGRALAAIGAVVLPAVERAVRVGDQGVAAQVVRVQVAQVAAPLHGDGQAVEAVVLDHRGGAADLLLHVEGEEGAGGLGPGHFFDAVAVGVVGVAFDDTQNRYNSGWVFIIFSVSLIALWFCTDFPRQTGQSCGNYHYKFPR